MPPRTWPTTGDGRWWRARRRRRREFVEFVSARRERGFIDARRIAVEWAADHSRDYPFGEYDPRLPKLEAKIRTMLQATR